MIAGRHEALDAVEEMIRFAAPLKIVVPGIGVSFNALHTFPKKPIRRMSKSGKPFLQRVVKTAEGAAWQSRVRNYAEGECIAIRWKPADACLVMLCLYHNDIDNDDASKPILDALQGVVYKSDRRVLDLIIRRRPAGARPRVEIFVTPL